MHQTRSQFFLVCHNQTPKPEIIQEIFKLKISNSSWFDRYFHHPRRYTDCKIQPRYRGVTKLVLGRINLQKLAHSTGAENLTELLSICKMRLIADHDFRLQFYTNIAMGKNFQCLMIYETFRNVIDIIQLALVEISSSNM